MLTTLIVVIQLGFGPVIAHKMADSMTVVTTTQNGFSVRYRHDKSVRAYNRDDFSDYARDTFAIVHK